MGKHTKLAVHAQYQHPIGGDENMAISLIKKCVD